MGFLAFFEENEKGLFYSDGKRIYFPDRKFMSATRGLARVDITNDKEKYAFVCGEMVKSLSINDEVLVKFCIEKNILDISLLNRKDSECEYAILRSDTGFIYFVYQDEEGLKVAFEFDGTSVESAYQRRFFNGLDWRFCPASSSVISKILFLRSERVTHDEVMELLVNTYYENVMHTGEDTYTVYTDRLINIRGTYYVKSKDSFQRVVNIPIDKTWSKYTVTVDEVRDFMIKNNISLSGMSSPTVTRYIHAFDTNFDITCFSSSAFKMKYLGMDVYADKVKQDAEMMESARKQYGKYCGAKQISELQKLMPRKYLF